MTELLVGPDAAGVTLGVRDGLVVDASSIDPGAPRLPCEGARLEPGAVNAHTHLYGGLAPLGMPAPEPAPESFVQILERVWWRLDRALDAASLRASARLYVAEALLSGTTTLIDHHESPALVEGSLDILAGACRELGARALLAYGATERNGGREEARAGLRECARMLGAADETVRGAVALHASFTVSDDTIRDAAAMAKEHGAVMHVHVAEDGADVDDAKARGYAGPLERLMELGALPPGSILAHGVFLSGAQVRRASEAGLWLVQNPRSNRGNRVGYPGGLHESTRVALGTDGYPARMDDEAAALREEAARHREAEDSIAPRLSGGHRLAEERFGRSFAPLAPGAAADLRAVGDDGVRHVVVAGRVVVRDGSLVGAGLDAIRADAASEAERLWARMRAL